MKQYKEDDIIVKQGDILSEMYKIVYGKAAVFINYGKKDEHLIGILAEQKCFGAFGPVSGAAEPYTVIAVTDMLLMSIGSDNITEFIKENPRDAILIMKNMINMIDIMRTNIDLLMDELNHHADSGERKIDGIEASLRKYTLYSRTNDPGFLDKI